MISIMETKHDQITEKIYKCIKPQKIDQILFLRHLTNLAISQSQLKEIINQNLL